MSILARKVEGPAKLAPKTIDYTYTVTLDIKNREGKDLSEAQAVLRVDPTQPPGARVQIISASDEDGEALQDFLKEVEDEDNTMAKQAGGFWCGDNGENPEGEADAVDDPSVLTVLYEDETKAVLRPDLPKLAELLMQSDDNAEENGRKMKKKLMKRLEGEITLAKPSGEMTGFAVRMTRPMKMMLIAKLKVMTVDQSCVLAPNGHYRIDRLKMNVEGKAMGSRFGEVLDMRVSDLTPLRQ